MSKSNINTFLNIISESIKTKKPFGIVSGNQSGDLDSIVSSIAYSYFNHKTTNQKTIVPLLNFAKKELNSRKDVLLAFKRSEVDSTKLFFTDDIPYLINQGADELILVDHNTPQGTVKESLSHLPITGIIDHHEDEKKNLDIKPRIIQTSGSCSSLVTNYWNSVNDLAIFKDSSIIKLLLSALVIDTTNLTSKVETSDIEAFKTYQKNLGILGEAEFNITDFFKELKKAKNDIEGLGIKEIFAKDYKQFEFEIGSSEILKKVGITSIVQSFELLLLHTVKSEEELIASCNEFIEENDIDMLVLMTSFVNNENVFTREFAALGKDESDELLLKLSLDGTLKDELQLVPLSTSFEDTSLQLYQQVNVKYSRKQVAPALKRALEIL